MIITVISVTWLLSGYIGSKGIKELFKHRYGKALGDLAWTKNDAVFYSFFILAGPINLLSTLLMWIAVDWSEL